MNEIERDERAEQAKASLDTIKRLRNELAGIHAYLRARDPNLPMNLSVASAVRYVVDRLTPAPVVMTGERLDVV
jgi:hypothetical protein